MGDGVGRVETPHRAGGPTARSGSPRTLPFALLAPLALVVALGSSIGTVPESATANPAPGATSFACSFNLTTDAFTGADGTASAIGWAGNSHGVVTCLGGTLLRAGRVQPVVRLRHLQRAPDHAGSTPTGTSRRRSPPSDHQGRRVAITEFADRIVLGGNAYVAVYAGWPVTNPTDHAVDGRSRPVAGPAARCNRRADDRRAPRDSVVHDYVMAVDRFGNRYPWPTAQALAAAGTSISTSPTCARSGTASWPRSPRSSVPDRQLDDAYRSGFIYTQIARSGNDLNTGVNGYERGVQPRRHRHPGQPLHPG